MSTATPTVQPMPPAAADDPQDETYALSAIVFSGDLDRVMAALNLATATAATGDKVTLFFTFWGTAALIDPRKAASGKSLIERCFSFLLPKGTRQLKLSKLHMMGMGRRLMLREMKRKGVPSLDALFDAAANLGVDIIACEMAMTVMGIKAEEFRDYPSLRIAGACTYADIASRSKSTLFI